MPELNISEAEVARRIGCSREYLRQFRLGNRHMGDHPEWAVALCRMFGWRKPGSSRESLDRVREQYQEWFETRDVSGIYFPGKSARK